ncbi:MAG: prolipoprotein diacylglyceryl transferase, partial [Clostridia bacterium]|nr:prolipoprotein diacylglyceryl transferase [Clostridia bacterium]
VVAVWEGGLAIYGGIIAGILTALVYARKRKLKFIKLLDILAPCVWIGQVIGRWGNFINMEAYGRETSLPWRMGLLYSYLDNGVWDVEKYVHPTFLYESLWNLTALVLVLIFYKKKKFDGQICSIYFMWYGFGRMLIEGLRTDSLMLGNLRISQGVGFVSLILGIVLTIVFVKKHQSSKAAEDTDYTPVYADLNKDTPDQTEKSTEE